MPPAALLRETLLRLLGAAVEEALADPAVTEVYTVEGDPRGWLDRRRLWADQPCIAPDDPVLAPWFEDGRGAVGE